MKKMSGVKATVAKMGSIWHMILLERVFHTISMSQRCLQH